MMFKTERKLRVAHAISDEMFYQRYGFVRSADSDEPPSALHMALAEAAILAMDGDLDALDAIRIARRKIVDTLLAAGAPLVIEL